MESLALYNYTYGNILEITKSGGKDPLQVAAGQFVTYVLPSRAYGNMTFIQDKTANSPLQPLQHLFLKETEVQSFHGFQGSFFSMHLTCNQRTTPAIVYALTTSTQYSNVLGEFVSSKSGWTLSWVRTSLSQLVPIGFAPQHSGPQPPAPAPSVAGFMTEEAPIVIPPVQQEFKPVSEEPCLNVELVRICKKSKPVGCDFSKNIHEYGIRRLFGSAYGGI